MGPSEPWLLAKCSVIKLHGKRNSVAFRFVGRKLDQLKSLDKKSVHEMTLTKMFEHYPHYKVIGANSTLPALI